MEKPKVIANYRLLITNTNSYDYHIAQIPDAQNIDFNKATVKEKPPNIVKVTTDSPTKPKSFTGQPRGKSGTGTSFYLCLFKRPTGEYSAIPIKDWYKFQKDITYRTFSTQEEENIVS